MSRWKSLYHGLVPPPIRYPIGRLRRGAIDRFERLATPGPLPPRRLLTRVQMTPWIGEYLEVGGKAAAAVGEALRSASPPPGGRLRVLDFGCGLGRVLRHFGDRAWELHGCDVDQQTLAWSRRAFPFARFVTSDEEPPLPYPASRFDAVYAVSVFTHFDAGEQRRWAAELARVIAPGGLAVVTAMGPRVFAGFVPVASAENRRRLDEDGFFFHSGAPNRRTVARGTPNRAAPGGGTPRPEGSGGGSSFNLRGAFHTAAGLERIFAAGFERERWVEGGLDGFQDLAVFRRRVDGSADGALELTSNPRPA